jgi:hypothetical protein
LEIWQGALLIAVAIGVALTVARVHLRRRERGIEATMSSAARRLGGRIDPLSENVRCPAILADVDGHLIRISGWPAEGEGASIELPPYLELCTPVEGIGSPLLVVRRSVLTRLLPLLSEDLRKNADADIPEAGISIFGAHGSTWAPRLFEAHRAWILVELDHRMLRVLTTDPQNGRFTAEAAERAVREYAAAVSSIVAAATIDASRHG